MSDELAIPLLYDAVAARFASEDTPCSLHFGWREPPRQVTGPRIVMVPGDPNGAAGEVGMAKHPGRNPRPLANFAELFHIVVSGAGDATDPTNERAAYIATRLLFDAWYRAAWKFAGNRMTPVSAEWLIERSTARFATTLVAVFAMDASINDLSLTTVDFAVRGLATVSLLDVDEEHETETAPAEVRVAARSPIALSGTQTIDGVSVIATNRVLVTGQIDAAENGIYVVAAGAWARSDDALTSLMFIRATAGTTGPALYRLDTSGTITPDVTAQTWTRITPEP